MTHPPTPLHARASVAGRAAAEDGLRLTPSAYRALRVSISEAAGPEAADEALFRLGLRWGEGDASGLEPSSSPRERLELGAALASSVGLGRVWIDESCIDRQANSCRIVGRVLDPLGSSTEQEGGPPEERLCVLLAGYLTGMARGITGMDLVCAPFPCARECVTGGCAFEIRPAHSGRSERDGRQAPAGSARFFLDSMGSAFGDRDISLSDLIENTSDAVVLVDREDIVRYWNRGAERMFQWRRDEVVGKRVGFIVPEDLLEAGELRWIQERLELDGNMASHVTRRVRKDGEVLDVSLTRTILHDSRGRVIGSTAILRDISDLARAQAELCRVQGLALVGQLAAKVAHEIKNPLAGIYGAVQILSRTLPAGDDRREVFDEVAVEIQRLDEIAQDLLRFARPAEPRLSPIELRSFVADLVDSLEFRIEHPRHDVRIEMQEDLLVRADPRLLGQLFRNLLHNSLQALDGAAQAPGGQPGRIAIAARRRDDLVEILVEDDGPGIPDELLERIFEPFFTTKSRGTGLGLAIAKKNVEAQGGTIRAGAGPGGGARFHLTLPPSEPPLAKTGAAPAAGA